jgi:hypothetical protein
MITHERLEALGSALGLWPGTRWLLTVLPVWLTPGLLGFAPLDLWLAAKLFIELRLPKLQAQYKGLWPGDVFLGGALWALISGVVFYVPPGTISSFWRSHWWDAATAIVIVLAVVPLAVIEYISAIRNRHNPKPWTYTLYQLHTPSCLAHRVSMALGAYVLMKFGIVSFATAGVPWVLKLLGIAGLLAWAYCAGYLDNFKPRPTDLGAIHPRHKAWFRLV